MVIACVLPLAVEFLLVLQCNTGRMGYAAHSMVEVACLNDTDVCAIVRNCPVKHVATWQEAGPCPYSHGMHAFP